MKKLLKWRKKANNHKKESSEFHLFCYLPLEIQIHILSYGDEIDLFVFSRTSQTWRSAMVFHHLIDVLPSDPWLIDNDIKRLKETEDMHAKGIRRLKIGNFKSKLTPFVVHAVRKNNIALLDWAHEDCSNWGLTSCVEAAKTENLDVLNWALQKGYDFSKDESIFKAALESGWLKGMQWAMKHTGMAKAVLQVTATRGTWVSPATQRIAHVNRLISQTICHSAASHGHVHLLDWLLETRRYGEKEISLECQKICRLAAQHGHLDILVWMKSHNLLTWPTKDRTEFITAAVISGNVGLVAFLISEGFGDVLSHLNILRLFSTCAQEGKTAMMTWLFETFPSQITKATMLEVVETVPCVDSLAWLDVYCDWTACVTPSFKQSVLERGKKELCDWLVAECRQILRLDDPNLCLKFAHSGNLEGLQWARRRGCAWDGRVCLAAAKTDQYILLWALANDVPSSKKDLWEVYKYFDQSDVSGCWPDLVALVKERGGVKLQKRRERNQKGKDD